MSSNRATLKMSVYINHIKNAQRILEKLPNKMFRDPVKNDLIYKQQETIKTLIESANILLNDPNNAKS